jgi:hypothetical protein
LSVQAANVAAAPRPRTKPPARIALPLVQPFAFIAVSIESPPRPEGKSDGQSAVSLQLLKEIKNLSEILKEMLKVY